MQSWQQAGNWCPPSGAAVAFSVTSWENAAKCNSEKLVKKGWWLLTKCSGENRTFWELQQGPPQPLGQEWIFIPEENVLEVGLTQEKVNLLLLFECSCFYGQEVKFLIGRLFPVLIIRSLGEFLDQPPWFVKGFKAWKRTQDFFLLRAKWAFFFCCLFCFFFFCGLVCLFACLLVCFLFFLVFKVVRSVGLLCVAVKGRAKDLSVLALLPCFYWGKKTPKNSLMG